MRVINPTVLRLFSYRKIDSYYEVPLRILREEKDNFGCQLMLCLKHHGGIWHLRSYLQGHEKYQKNGIIRNELTHMANPQYLQDADVVSDDGEF
jgi:hypothetical protein